ncbi:MAG: peroxide stress protein YaaA, partial [Pseudomonadota bacterium]
FRGEALSNLDPYRARVIGISPVFQDEKAGHYKVISFYAKRARGLMARYAIEQRVSHPDDLLGFAAEGYAFDAKASAPLKPVFRRAEQS